MSTSSPRLSSKRLRRKRLWMRTTRVMRSPSTSSPGSMPDRTLGRSDEEEAATAEEAGAEEPRGEGAGMG